jgi:hypothetical protein
VSYERVYNLTGDLALIATLDREIAAKLKGYSDIRTTSASVATITAAALSTVAVVFAKGRLDL